MASLFTRIVNGEIPCHKVAETEKFLAFLDISPLAKGHVLVIPKSEVDYLFDLDDETYVGLQLFAKYVAKALEAAVPCKKIGMAVIGLEVAHAHIHLVPMEDANDLNFTRDKMQPSQEELAETAAAIRAKL
jgi:histidine triad (HIT) family protein